MSSIKNNNICVLDKKCFVSINKHALHYTLVIPISYVLTFSTWKTYITSLCLNIFLSHSHRLDDTFVIIYKYCYNNKKLWIVSLLK